VTVERHLRDHAPSFSSLEVLVDQEVLAVGLQERSEATFAPISPCNNPFFGQAPEMTLSEVKSLIRVVTFSPDERVGGVPVGGTEVSPGFAGLS
jgi:hypothetical protein